MKIYKNYSIRIDLENEEEIRRLTNLISFGIDAANSGKAYITDKTKAFGMGLLSVLQNALYFENMNEEGTNNDTNN